MGVRACACACARTCVCVWRELVRSSAFVAQPARFSDGVLRTEHAGVQGQAKPPCEDGVSVFNGGAVKEELPAGRTSGSSARSGHRVEGGVQVRGGDTPSLVESQAEGVLG